MPWRIRTHFGEAGGISPTNTKLFPERPYAARTRVPLRSTHTALNDAVPRKHTTHCGEGPDEGPVDLKHCTSSRTITSARAGSTCKANRSQERPAPAASSTQ